MDKKVFFVIGIVVLLVIGGQACPRRGEEVRGREYRVGNLGLVMNFVPNIPPPKLYDLNDLMMGIELRNMGAYPASDEQKDLIGRIYLSGFDPNYIRFNEGNYQEIDRNLYGKDQYNPEGGYTVMYFNAPNIILSEGVESYRPILKATSCYEYKTVAAPVVCIDPNPYGTTQVRKVCTVHDISLATQGGPVGVTRVEEAILKDRVQFKIHIKNVGDGMVVDRDQLTACPGKLDYSNLDIVDFYGEISGRALYDCRPNPNKVRLYNGQGTIACYATKPAAGNAYTTPLKIELEYGYSSSITKQIEIVKTPE